MRLRTLPTAALALLVPGACSLSHQLDDLKGQDAGVVIGGSAGAPGDAGDDAPVEPEPVLPLAALAAGGQHGCVLDGAGEVFCWGANLNGQLGSGELGGKRGKLGRALLPEKAKAIACGGRHSCAIGVSGAVYCWGGGSDGQLGSGSSDSPTPTSVPGQDALLAVAAGANHTCALSETAVTCWGDNARGQLGVADPSATGPETLPLAAGALAAGALHTCALGQGKVWCWGANESGQVGEPGLPDQHAPHLVELGTAVPTRLAAGGRHSCVAASDDSVLCWGSNAKGQLGLGTSGAAPVAPSQVPGLAAKALALGDAHSSAVTTGGAAACWGDDAAGQIGNGDLAAPVLQPYLHALGDVSAVAAGTAFTCALTGGGQSLYCWGDNKTQQMGESAEQSEPSPVQLL